MESAKNSRQPKTGGNQEFGWWRLLPQQPAKAFPYFLQGAWYLLACSPNVSKDHHCCYQ